MRAWGGPESRLRLSGLVSGNLKKGLRVGEERGYIQNKGLKDILKVTWLEGFWDNVEKGS